MCLFQFHEICQLQWTLIKQYRVVCHQRVRPEILALCRHCSAKFQPIFDCFIPNFKLKYPDSENIKTDCVVVFKLHQTEKRLFVAPCSVTKRVRLLTSQGITYNVFQVFSIPVPKIAISFQDNSIYIQKLFNRVFIIFMDFLLGYEYFISLLAVTGVMHEADVAYSIQSTCLCYWLDEFVTQQIVHRFCWDFQCFTGWPYVILLVLMGVELLFCLDVTLFKNAITCFLESSWVQLSLAY